MHTITRGYSRPLAEVKSSFEEPAAPIAKRWKSDAITFTDKDARGIQTFHDDAVVISLIIANYDVKRVLVDNGSSANMLFYEAFQKMNLPI